MMKSMCTPGMISKWLVVIGGINWGLVGAFNFNLVNMLVGSWPIVERVVYVLVGLAALMVLAHMFGMCKKCCEGGACKGGKCEGGNCGGSSESKPQM